MRKIADVMVITVHLHSSGGQSSYVIAVMPIISSLAFLGAIISSYVIAVMPIISSLASRAIQIV